MTAGQLAARIVVIAVLGGFWLWWTATFVRVERIRRADSLTSSEFGDGAAIIWVLWLVAHALVAAALLGAALGALAEYGWSDR